MSLILLYNNLSAGLEHYKTLTEALLAADSISTQVIFNFGLLDSYNILDVRSSAPSIVYNDIFYPTESIIKSPIKSLLDTLQSGASLSLHPNKNLADTFQLNDLKQALANKYLDDVLTSSDLSRFNVSMFLEDTDYINEQIARSAVFNRDLLDTMTLQDVKVISRGLFRSLSDSFALSDGGATFNIFKALADAVTYTDVIHTVDANFLYFSETFLATDAHELAAVFNRDYTDNALMQEVKSSYVAKAAQETSSILEVREAQWLAQKAFTESFNLNDSLDTTSIVFRNLEDSMQAGELQDLASVFNRQFTETVTLSEILSKLASLGILESFGITDTREVISAINMAESVLVNEDFSSTRVYSRALAEVLLGDDTHSILVNKTANDIFNLIETFSKAPSKNFNEILTAADSASLVNNFNRDYIETGRITDEVAKNILKQIETSENIIDSSVNHPGTFLTDQSLSNDYTSVGFNKVFTDTIQIRDSFAREVLWYKSIDNSIVIKYIIDMAMLRKKSLSGFVWKDAFEGSQKMFGKRRSKKGFVN